MERVFTWSILILLYYAYLQIFSYIILGSSITGRMISEVGRDLGGISIFGTTFYRANSLAGEPRDWGTFLVGAIPFYMYVRYGGMNRLAKINIVLMVFAFLLTTSTSAFLAAGLSLFFIILDSAYQRRGLIRVRYIKYIFLTFFIIVLVFRGEIFKAVGQRTVSMYESIATQLQTAKAQSLAGKQAVDLVVLYYILNLSNVSPMYSMFGYGYSNYITPAADLLQRHFSLTVKDVGVVAPASFAVKLFIEGGIVGIMLYVMIFFYSLRLNRLLLRFYRERNDWQNYNRILFLRFSFIAFFVANTIQISFYYIIIIGLIIGQLNEISRKELQHGEPPSASAEKLVRALA